MSYMWNEFNIKTFPAETVVFRNGQYCPDLSTLPNAPINQNYDLPVHFIFIGEIAGKINMEISVGAKNQDVIISADLKIKKPAFLNVFIKNAGENSKISGSILIDNHSDLEYECNAHHFFKNTAVLIKNKVLAGKNSYSKLSGVAVIDPGCPDCESDVAIVAMADTGAKIDFMPAQKISSMPKQADHSASLYEPTDAQILYLRQAGLGILEIKDVTKEAFLNE